MTKSIWMFMICGLLFVTCENEPESREVGTDVIDIPSSMEGEKRGKRPKIEFDQTEFDTGKITQGEQHTFTYKFTNIGDGPLIISSVDASCGCTVMKNYPKGKIMPGEGGEIVASFDSDNKWGEQVVTINVATNTVPNLTQLLIKTDIVVPDQLKTK